MNEIVLKSKTDTKKLIFIFHGYGANNEDLSSVGEMFSEAVPEAEVHIANGVEECESGIGYQWFSLRGENINSWEDEFSKSAHKITSYIDSVISDKKIDYKDVIFAGFSQGAMISLSLGLKYEVQAVIAFSGLLLNLRSCAKEARTKVLLAHGTQDDVIPITTMALTEKALKNAGISVKTIISAELGHGIDDYVLARSVDFLKSL